MHGKAPRGTFWKTQYVLEYAEGRPFAWVDDDITRYDHEYVERNHLAAALLLRVDERIGPIRPDFDALAEWAAALYRRGAAVFRGRRRFGVSAWRWPRRAGSPGPP